MFFVFDPDDNLTEFVFYSFFLLIFFLILFSIDCNGVDEILTKIRIFFKNI